MGSWDRKQFRRIGLIDLGTVENNLVLPVTETHGVGNAQNPPPRTKCPLEGWILSWILTEYKPNCICDYARYAVRHANQPNCILIALIYFNLIIDYLVLYLFVKLCE